MIAIKRGCLAHDELQQVLAGQLPPEEFESAISHLDNCDDCREAADAIQQDGHWLIESLDSDQPDPWQAETACQVALWRMLETPIANPARLGNSVPCDQLGPYRLIQPLGAGGMGTVYLAQHDRLKRQCAIKLLPRERVDQPGWLERFDREMTTIASLQHPNVVHATDAGHEAGWHYLVMEHLDGLDVGRIASRMGRIEVADACEIIRQAALGLAHVHNSGLVHRDIKPSNLMLTRSGTVKLLDLGLVLAGDDPLGVDDRLTTVGHLMGTMPYMAPEQLADSHQVDPRADIYSLGATLYRLIAGRPPHQRQGGLASHVLAITNEDAPPLDSIRDDVNRDVVTLVSEMLSRDPSARTCTAEDVANRLAGFGKDSRLKGLLREALRRRGDDDSIQPSLLPSLNAQNAQPPRHRLRKWLIGGIFASLLCLAAIVIKIQTDKGDLVVHSEHDGLTIVIKQDDKVVDRLLITKSDNNRTRLHKGTYRVDIEGGGEALALSDEVVTIGRGADTAIQVTQRQANANERQVAAQQPAGAPGATPRSQPIPLFRGQPLDHWLEILKHDKDVDAIGEAMVAAVTLKSREANVAKAILNRAREFGGFEPKTPPPPNSSGFEITESEHFMWYFHEAFGAFDATAAIEAVNEELKIGNGRSRAAALYGLTLFDWDDLYQMLDEVEGRFLISDLLRNCAGLCAARSIADTWKELEGESRTRAALMAYQTAFRLAIVRELDPLSIPPVAEIFHTRQPKDMSIDELLLRYELMGDSIGYGRISDAVISRQLGDALTGVFADRLHDANLKWSNRPVAEPAEMETDPLADNAEDPDAVAVFESDAGLLFQGQPLEHWLDLLSREQDPISLGKVLQAVEVLTREHGDRAAAAAATLKVARRWGGAVMEGPGLNGFNAETDPSHVYTYYLHEIFPGYMPHPGIEVIATELKEGNNQSRIAAMLLLVSVDQWAAKIQQSPEERALLERLYQGVKEAVVTLKAGRDLPAIPIVGGGDETILAAGWGMSIGIKLRLLMEQPIAGELWLEDHVRSSFKRASNEWTKHKAVGEEQLFQELGMYNPWMLDEDILVAAVQLPDVISTAENLELAAANLVISNFVHHPDRLTLVVKVVTEKAPATLLKTIEDRLTSLSVAVVPENKFGPTYFPVQILEDVNSIWAKLLPWYAENVKSVSASLKLMQSIREQMTSIRRSQPTAEINLDLVDQAINTLHDRLP